MELVKSEKKHKRQKQQEVTTFMFTNETLRAAIHEYCTPSTKQATIEKYGHIQDWNVTHVTNMSYLFANEDDFNEDISNWDVSKVENMIICLMTQVLSINLSMSGMCPTLHTWNICFVEHMLSINLSMIGMCQT